MYAAVARFSAVIASFRHRWWRGDLQPPRLELQLVRGGGRDAAARICDLLD